MPQPRAYLNGSFVPAAQASVSVFDGGFVQGTTIAEQMRTFGGRLFQLPAHIERLFRSLAILGIDPGPTAEQLAEIAEELVEHNHSLLAPGDDLGLSMFVTPGPYAAMVADPVSAPTVCLHTFPLRFGLWAAKYREGEQLATTGVAQVPPECWPPELKCRSRMHYFLADRQARQRHPGSRALMLDAGGFVTEASTANVVLYRADAGLITPPREKILPGISVQVLLELAAKLGLAHVERDITSADVASADEMLLTSTSPCVLPVVRFNGKPLGSGSPGPTFQNLLTAWSEMVGLDIADQARHLASR